GIARQPFQPADQTVKHRGVVGVADLGPVQCHAGHAAVIDVQQNDIPAHDATTFPGSVLPPHITTPTRAPCGGSNLPETTAARAVAPPGSAISRICSHNRRCVAAICSSVPSTAPVTNDWAIGNINAPTCRAPNESAARPDTGQSSGRPTSMAVVNVGHPSGSTQMISAEPAYQAAMPPINPPPPVATRIWVSSGASIWNSRPTVP